jgi:hypothetical protein
MPFVILLVALFIFSWFYPKAFTVFYWCLLLPVFTIFPACVLHLLLKMFGMQIHFFLSFVIALAFCGYPLTKKFSPRVEF